MHDGVEELLPEMLESITSTQEEFIVETIDFGRIIGESTLVETDEHDQVYYAIRKGRMGHTRLVRNRDPIDCSVATIVLERTESHYVIISCYIGHRAEPEPWDKRADENAFEFWKKRALICGREDIIDGSTVNVCPWNLNRPAICKITYPIKESST